MISAELLTLSYAPDFEVCRLLCESVDRFLPHEVVHKLIVPRSDLALFSILASDRRSILVQEDLLPVWFFRLPMPSPSWRRKLFLPRRDVFVIPFGKPVRGWIAQQIMKIAAAYQSKADVVVHVDSDTVFIRSLKKEHLYKDGCVRLYRDPKPAGLETHARWQKAAGQLLGLPDKPFYGGEYIDSCVVWKTTVLREMTERIASISGSSWLKTLSRTPHFAEYVLYGVYAAQVLGCDAAQLVPESFSLCHARWAGDFDSPKSIDDFIEALEPHHLTCLIQSTNTLSLDLRREIFTKVTEFAARQDSAVE